MLLVKSFINLQAACESIRSHWHAGRQMLWLEQQWLGLVMSHLKHTNPTQCCTSLCTICIWASMWIHTHYQSNSNPFFYLGP
jgi:hypothetical protein